MNKYKQRIITFGGGTGQFHLLDGLRELNDTSLITAVASTWDSGGSSGRLRTELGVLPPGDVRRCMLALMEDSEQRMVAQRLFDDRLEEIAGPLKGHSLGNLITARLENIYRGQDRALKAEGELFRISAKILPATLANVNLIAETSKGLRIDGEANIDTRSGNKKFDSKDRIVRIYFDSRTDVNPEVLKCINHADKIIFAPGDLYTSVLPHLLVDGVSEAIIKSKAKLIIVLNLATKSGETDDYKASDFLKAFVFYLGSPTRINYLIVNKNSLDKEIIDVYKKEGQNLVDIDSIDCLRIAPGVKIVKANIARYLRKEHLLRHDPKKLSSVIMNI
jgi:uncharacterized cofD-like protein